MIKDEMENILSKISNEDLKEAYKESKEFEEGVGGNKYHALITIRNKLKEKCNYKRWYTSDIPNLVYAEIARRTIDLL